MRRTAAALVALLALSGCMDDKPAVTERWFVIQRAYVPSTHGDGWSYGKGGGYVSVTTDEKWSVVMSTPHGVEVWDDKDAWAGATEGRCALVARVTNTSFGTRTVGWYWEPDTARASR